MTFFPKPTSQGFAMLFTVLIVMLMLSIGLGISNITYKQTILSSLAKDSETALYKADAGIECALYYDLNPSMRDFDGTKNISSLTCGDESLTGGLLEANHYVYTSGFGSGACIAKIDIDKRSLTTVIIQAYGNNICQPNPRQVERTLEVQYNQ